MANAPTRYLQGETPTTAAACLSEPTRTSIDIATTNAMPMTAASGNHVPPPRGYLSAYR